MVSEVVSTSNGMSIQADLVNNVEAELLPTSSSPKEKVATASQPPSPDGEVLSAKSMIAENQKQTRSSTTYSDKFQLLFNLIQLALTSGQNVVLRTEPRIVKFIG